MNPITPYLIALFIGFILLHYLWGRVTVAAWWAWQQMHVGLGIHFTGENGLPPGEYPDDDGTMVWEPGFPAYYSINIGLLLLMVRFTWFGRIPKEWPNKIPPV